MNSVLKSRAYRVTVTGNFDIAAFLQMSNLLGQFGTVQSTFFDAASGRHDAVATFMVSTMHDADDVQTLLANSNVTVHVEANHA